MDTGVDAGSVANTVTNNVLVTVTSGMDDEETGFGDGSAETMTMTVLVLVTVTAEDDGDDDPGLDELATGLE